MISQGTATVMARALRTAPCGCQFARTAGGVPTWSGNGQSRIRITTCTRCAALDMYERERTGECNHVYAIPNVAQCAYCREDMPPSEGGR